MTPRAQLVRFLSRFDPPVARLARAVLSRLRTRLPSANHLVYDNYNALAIGFSATERAYDSIFSVAVFARGVNLFFFNGPNLPDPQRLLKGHGNMVRHIRVERIELLDDPAVHELMEVAIDGADPPLARSGRGRVIIKSISKKRRSRSTKHGERTSTKHGERTRTKHRERST
jgi:hypothetical protein